MNKRSIVKVPGSCGELVQGRINGKDFLVSCPVNLFSYVSVTVDTTGEIKCSQAKWKSKLAMRKTLDFFQLKNFGGEIKINSEIPVGKGMASSTADIVGVCLATSNAIGKSLQEIDIAKIALSIEPTDGTVFKGITLFDHRKGLLYEHLGASPRMKIFAIDLGGYVDTIEFNKNDFTRIHQSNESEIVNALNLVRRGIKEKNISLIGKGATISAKANQKILFKLELEKIIELSYQFEALGVNVAHSGTMVGILLKPEFDKIDILKLKIQETFQRKFQYYELELIGGGGESIEY
ncbi:MAG: hypothetical protein ACK4JE_04605 [Endomicrobiia bacterium]